MLELKIKRKKEVRCANCLIWNDKDNKFCQECSVPIVPTDNYGAVLYLIPNYKYSSGWKKIKKSLKKENKEKVLYWNNLFREQLDHIRTLIFEYSNISSDFILEIKEEIEKTILVTVPMSPENFKIFSDYKLPDERLPQDQKLEYLFRSHPLPVFRHLAAMSLVHSGKASKEICSALLAWQPHSRKLHQERLLTLCHWSAMMYFDPYDTTDILVLHEEPGMVSQWAKLYLYLARYQREELKPQLETIIQKGPKHLALSCAVALNQFVKIKGIVGDTISEDTLDLQLKYAEESQLTMFLQYLQEDHADYAKKIIDKCCSISEESKNREQIIQWLLVQDKAELFEGIFRWQEIPALLSIVEYLITLSGGVNILSKWLPLWIRQQDPSPPDSLATYITQVRLDSINEEDRVKFETLQTEFFELYFNRVCEEVRSNPSEGRSIQLLGYLFSEDRELSTHLADRCFATLYYVAGEKSDQRQLFFSLTNKNIEKVSPDADTFFEKMRKYLEDQEINHNCNEWLEELLKAQCTSEQRYDLHTLNSFFKLMFSLAERDKLRTYTQCQMLEFLSQNLELLQEFPDLKYDLENLKKHTRDQNILYWLSKIEES